MASAEPATGDAQDEAALYKGAVEDLRSSLTCKICLKFLYEPFTTSCGHTFCYECLNQWFKDHINSKTCPVCRSRVRQQPAQAFAIREMVQTLCKDARLLPPGERTEEHKLLREEMTFLMESHRKAGGAKGGLFEGSFRYEEEKDAIFDESDGVWRCPECTAELDSGFCNSCGGAYDTDGRPIDPPTEVDEGSDLYVSEFSSDVDHLDVDALHEIEADVLGLPPGHTMSSIQSAALHVLMANEEPGPEFYPSSINSDAPLADNRSVHLSDDISRDEDEEEEAEVGEDDESDDGSSVQSNISDLIDDGELESSDDDTSGQYESPSGYDVDAGTEAESASASDSEDGLEPAESETSDYDSPATRQGLSLHPSVEFPQEEVEGGYSWTSDSEVDPSDGGSRPRGRGPGLSMPVFNDNNDYNDGLEDEDDEDDIQTAPVRKSRKRARVVISDDEDDEDDGDGADDDSEPIARPPKRPRAEVEDDDKGNEEAEEEGEEDDEAERNGVDDHDNEDDAEEDTDEDEPVVATSRSTRPIARSLFGASRAVMRLSISSEDFENSEEESEKDDENYGNADVMDGHDTGPDVQEETRDDEEEEGDDPNLGPRARARRERLRNAITKATGVRPSPRTGLTTASWAGGVRA